MDSTTITWQDPPKRTRRSAATRDLDEFVEALQSQPGRWALYPRRMSTGWAYGLRGRVPTLITRISNEHVDEDGKTRADVYVQWPIS